MALFESSSIAAPLPPGRVCCSFSSYERSGQLWLFSMNRCDRLRHCALLFICRTVTARRAVSLSLSTLALRFESSCPLLCGLYDALVFAAPFHAPFQTLGAAPLRYMFVWRCALSRPLCARGPSGFGASRSVTQSPSERSGAFSRGVGANGSPR